MTTTTKRFAVPFLLSFGDERDAGGYRVLKVGRGEAGWTVAEFDDLEEAQAFADSLPACSRVRNHGISDRLAPLKYPSDTELATR